MEERRELIVETPEPIRIDRYLSSVWQDLSRSRLQKLIEDGHVSVNQQKITDKKTTIKTNDRITLILPPNQSFDLVPQSIPLPILYEDDHLLVVNKPVGLVVHPAPGHVDNTLVNAILAHCTHLSGINGIERPGIVHRLDKDTSGAIVIAKTDRAHQSLQQQIQNKTAKREYLGIVHGVPTASTGTIDAPIGRHPKDRHKMAVIPTGRPALTHWQVQERLGMYGLLHFQLATGRTHQIRVHSAHMGHPIVGDPLYSRVSPKIATLISHQALHAWKLTFQHPETGKTVALEAPPPPSFLNLVQRLRSQR
jgi:23S rRNA pseudouridine1911/1915/1917 synthase